MPQAWQVVLKVGKAEATDALRIALDTVPTDGDTRSEFFVQWRARTLTDLEKIFQEASPPVRRFREIEFSPRRLSGDEDRDGVMRREACLSGCAVARHLLQMILDRLSQLPDVQPAAHATDDAAATEPAPAAEPEAAAQAEEADALDLAPSGGGEETPPDTNDTQPEAPASVEPNAAAAAAAPAETSPTGEPSQLVFAEPAAEPAPAAMARPAPAAAPVAAPAARPPRQRPPARPIAAVKSEVVKSEVMTMQGKVANASTHSSSAVTATGRSQKLAASVRSSLGRFLAACEKGDPNAASVLSARLFADLMVLGEDPRFRAAFEEVMAQSATDGSEGAAHEAAANAEALAAVAPAALWSAVVAIGRLADPRFDAIKPAA